MVGETGFEPATLCSQNRCATRLRYSPTKRALIEFGAFNGNFNLSKPILIKITYQKNNHAQPCHLALYLADRLCRPQAPTQH